MIQFTDFNKKYGKSNALINVNLTLAANKSYALLGPNGSGKTTLIKCILGMAIPSSGSLLVAGENVQNDFKYRRNIGYMPQAGQFPSNMTVKQVFTMMKDMRIDAANDLDEDLYSAYKIESFSHKKTSALSGGMRQKLSACLAFLFNPSILILDEPTAGLDPISSEILKEKIIQERRKDKLIIITSHILSDLDEIITDLIYLQDGHIIFNKPVTDLKDATGEKGVTKIISHLLKESVPA